MGDFWRDFWLRETGTGQQVAQLYDRYDDDLLFVLFYVLFVCKCVLPQGDNPIAVNKYIIYGSKSGQSKDSKLTC